MHCIALIAYNTKMIEVFHFTFQVTSQNHHDAMQNKKSSHFISLFHHFFTFTLYSNTSHALFGILYHELTSQNQGNDVQLPATCWQSKSNVRGWRSARFCFYELDCEHIHAPAPADRPRGLSNATANKQGRLGQAHAPRRDVTQVGSDNAVSLACKQAKVTRPAAESAPDGILSSSTPSPMSEASNPKKSEDLYAPVMKAAHVRLMVEITAQIRFKMLQTETKPVVLNGDIGDDTIYKKEWNENQK
jgi:hypothetical protein